MAMAMAMEMEMEIDGGILPGLPNDVAIKILLLLPPSSLPTLRTVSSLWRTLFDSYRFYLDSKRTWRSPSLFVSPSSKAFRIPLPFTLKFFEALSAAKAHMCSVILAVKHRVVVMESSRQIRVFNALTSQWSIAPPMRYPRKSFVGCVIDTRVVVAGLVESIPNRTPTEAYDPSTNSWTALPDIPQPVHVQSMVVIDGNLLLIAMSGLGAHHCVYSYDPHTKLWSEERAPQNRMLAKPYCDRTSLVALSNGNLVRGTCYRPPFAINSTIEVDLLPHEQHNEWIHLMTLHCSGSSHFLVTHSDQCLLFMGEEVLFTSCNPLYPHLIKVVSISSSQRRACFVPPPSLG